MHCFRAFSFFNPFPHPPSADVTQFCGWPYSVHGAGAIICRLGQFISTCLLAVACSGILLELFIKMCLTHSSALQWWWSRTNTRVCLQIGSVLTDWLNEIGLGKELSTPIDGWMIDKSLLDNMVMCSRQSKCAFAAAAVTVSEYCLRHFCFVSGVAAPPSP